MISQLHVQRTRPTCPTSKNASINATTTSFTDTES